MKSVVKFFVAPLVVLVVSAPASAVVISSVRFLLQGSVESSDGSAPTADREFFEYSDTQTALGRDVASQEHSEIATLSNGFVSLEGSGSAGLGELRASLKGFAKVTSSGEEDRHFVTASIPRFTGVTAKVTDVLTIRSPETAPGTRIIWVGTWQVDGDFDAGVVFSGEPTAELGTAIGTETLVTVASGVTTQGLVGDSPFFGPSRISLPREILVVVDTVSGIPSTFTNTLEIRATAAITRHFGNPSTGVTGFFENDFSNTMRWGGITSVTNADTGQPILNWTITSESGFDYSRPVPVPEPASVVLLIGCCILLGGRIVHRPRA